MDVARVTKTETPSLTRRPSLAQAIDYRSPIATSCKPYFAFLQSFTQPKLSNCHQL